MEFAIDIFFKLISYLPKFISFWLYSPDRTKKHIEVFVSAQEGTIVFWCDKSQSRFNIILEFKNNNPFPIHIDRMEISGYLYCASVKAMELIGAEIKPNKTNKLFIEGKIDPANLELINQSSNDDTLRLEVKAVIENEYYTIRDYRHSFERLMVKFNNRQVKKP